MTLIIRTPEDAIAAVPYLLGFHPSESLVVIGFDGPHSTCAVRSDLPPPGVLIGDRVAHMLRDNGFRRALLLGYGPADQVTSAASATWEALNAEGLDVVEALRVTDDRWWSLTCVDEDCCPSEGHPYDVSGSLIPAQATLAGHVALNGRTELTDSVRPVPGHPLEVATRQAEERFLSWAREGLAPARIQSRMAEEGIPLLSTLLSAPTPPSDADLAWLGVLLTSLRVRDEAWVRIDEDDPTPSISFWRHALRHLEPPYTPAPACLLAFAAYVSGDGGLANVALDRADEADPTYSMSTLLRQIIAAGIPPTKARIRMTPTELAAAYADPNPP
ncbi:DUF4192 domain-containing protein [Spirillospora sp. CA-294931]|uniref:DUF4192 domain-containing protein n=1 Tax=Spirillospora sp. CA-294931 TaxID=3240042 RepID=UPI003D8D3D3D